MASLEGRGTAEALASLLVDAEMVEAVAPDDSVVFRVLDVADPGEGSKETCAAAARRAKRASVLSIVFRGYAVL